MTEAGNDLRAMIVMLVDRDAVRFLSACEAEGVRFLHCPPYRREWILSLLHS